MTTTKTSKGGRKGDSSAFTSGKKPRGGRKGRKPVAPVKVGKDRNWGPIAMFVVVGLLAVGIIGYAFWQDRSTDRQEWQARAETIEGITDYRTDNPEVLSEEYRLHRSGPQLYDMEPPVAGPHNETWQNCQGTVYEAPIANEHAVHSLEHGAVWVTYNPDTLPADQVETLAGMVRQAGDRMLMSPYPGLEAPISLQAWGYQLQVQDANDPRIREFTQVLRGNAALEANGTCSGGNTATGTTPIG